MNDTLKTEAIIADDPELGVVAAKRLADEAAQRLLYQPVCLSWYDRDADRECPAHANECQHDSGIPGYIEYAASRGAELRVVVDDGRFVFCYRPLGEFAEQ